MWTAQVKFKNIYLHTNTHLPAVTMKKKTINLKESVW